MNILRKWKKKQLLCAFGLAAEEDIVEQTKRFTEINEALDYIRIDGSTYIIKLVPTELKPKLKNFIVNDDKSKMLFARDILNYHDYSEIWCCKNEYSGGVPIYGRFMTDDLSQTIEIIRGTTARLIENIPDIHSYAVGTRISWGRHYNAINKGNLPFHDVACWIEGKRDQIDSIFEQLKAIDVKALCLEFKVYKSGLVFIDWDTPDDKTVINRLWR